MWLHLKRPERLAQALAVLCLAIVILMAGKPAFTNASLPVRGIHDPGIALQVARNVDEVDSILGEAPSADREVMRLKQYLDFAFIAAYVSLAVVMAWVLARRMPLAAVALLVCTAAAAIFDILENLAILRLLPLELSQTTQPVIDAIRVPSAVKWSLISLALVLLSIFFFESRRWYLRVLGMFDLAAGALTCVGVFHNEWLPWAGALLSGGLLLSAATLNLLAHESAA
jgi:hypothetical protein